MWPPRAARKPSTAFANTRCFPRDAGDYPGRTSWFETGFYVFTSIQPDTTWEWVGDHIRPRVRAPESWDLPVGLSLSAEIGYQRSAFSTDTWTLELRPIVDKQWRRWYVSINPVLDRAIKGESTGKGFEFSPAANVSYTVAPKVAAGLEYYGSLGSVTHLTGRMTSSTNSSP